MTKIEAYFRDYFKHWNFQLPSEDVRNRRRGKIVEAGWVVWYLFGTDSKGDYLDFYAAHRMTNDRHVRVYEDGSEELLPTIRTGVRVTGDPEEDARLKAEFYEDNRQVAKILEEKGFCVEGDEPGGVLINRHLVTEPR